MKKSTKGALAAGAAAAILLGGAGTLAYWTADTDVDAGDLESGSITLDALACDGFEHSDGSAVDLIVPGDVVTNDCDATLVLTGDNIGATLTIDPASVDAADALVAADVALADELSTTGLTPTVTLLDDLGAPVAAEIEGAGTYVVTARITVTFPYGGPVSTPDPRTDASNGSQAGVAALDSLELVAVQTNTLN